MDNAQHATASRSVPVDAQSFGPKCPPLATAEPSLTVLADRPRRLLQGVQQIASDFLSTRLPPILDGVERELFENTLSESFRGSRGLIFASISEIKRCRADFVPQVMVQIDATLSALRSSSANALDPPLALLDEDLHIEESFLDDLASRAVFHHRRPVTELGWRLAVPLESPPFKPSAMPLGPRRLLEAILGAFRALELAAPLRLRLLKRSEPLMLHDYAGLIDTLNVYLANEHVLPTIGESWLIASDDDPKSKSQQPEDHAQAASPTLPTQWPMTAGNHPATTWPGETPLGALSPPPPASGGGGDSVSSMHELLSRAANIVAGPQSTGTASAADAPAPAPEATRDELISTFDALQKHLSQPDASEAVPVDLVSELVKRLTIARGDGTVPSLNRGHATALDLVRQLFDGLSADVRDGGPASPLLNRLQTPYARFAIEDSQKFFDPRHAAHAFLNGIAETDARWRTPLSDNDPLYVKAKGLVQQVLREFTGDPEIFERVWADLAQDLRKLVERAKTTEHRHVVAAKGREKIALARLSAQESIDLALEGTETNGIFRAVFTRAWREVLIMTALRSGVESESFKAHSALARRMVAAAASNPTPFNPDELADVKLTVRNALERSGLSDRDVGFITLMLTSSTPKAIELDNADAVVERLAEKPQVGEGIEVRLDGGVDSLDEETREHLQQLKFLPYGTWFEFSPSEPGEPSKRLRMAWFSLVTGHAMFVNDRGQRIQEHSLSWLAQEMTHQRLRVVTQQDATPMHRAWKRIMERVRHLSGNDGGAQ